MTLTKEERDNYKENFCPLDQKITRWSRIANETGGSMADWHWECDDCFYRARKPESLLNAFDAQCFEREKKLQETPPVAGYALHFHQDEVGVASVKLWAVFATHNSIPVRRVTLYYSKPKAKQLLQNYQLSLRQNT